MIGAPKSTFTAERSGRYEISHKDDLGALTFDVVSAKTGTSIPVAEFGVLARIAHTSGWRGYAFHIETPGVYQLSVQPSSLTYRGLKPTAKIMCRYAAVRAATAAHPNQFVFRGGHYVYHPADYTSRHCYVFAVFARSESVRAIVRKARSPAPSLTNRAAASRTQP